MLCQAYMHLLQGESDCGQTCISPRLQLIAIPATLNHHHLQREPWTSKCYYTASQPSICQAHRAVGVTEGQSCPLPKYPSHVQTCKSPTCPLIFRKTPNLRYNAERKVWWCTQVKIQDLHSHPRSLESSPKSGEAATRCKISTNSK